MKHKFLLIIATAFLLITGCDKNNNSGGGGGSKPDGAEATPVTDKLKFAQADSLEGKRFASDSTDSSSFDHYGYVTLRSCTDGDTANFVQKDYVDVSGKQITIKTRFLGVNTPESTAKVEPWGKKASLFTKHILEEAQAKADEESAASGKEVYTIALITDPAVMGERDSSGNRWLAFVWYRLGSNAKWRNINLELVEMGYSKNQLFLDSSVCDYRQSFVKAEENAKKNGIRVHGEVDDGYDYTTKTYEYSIWGIQNHYEEIGISDQGSSGVQLKVTALVVGIQGDNLYLRDVLVDEEQYEKEGANARLAGTYGYAGFGSALCSTLQNASRIYEMDGTGVGLIVRFFCRATTYSGNIQLSDIKTATTGSQAFKVIVPDNFDKYKEELKWSHLYNEKQDLEYTDLQNDIAPVAIDTKTIDRNHSSADCQYEDLLPYIGQWVQLDMTVRAVSPAEDDDDENAGQSTSESSYWYNPTANSTSYTVYAYFVGKDDAKIYTNIRIDTSITPFVNKPYWGTDDRYDVSSEKSPVGKTWKVTGYLVRYYNKFQVQLGNNYPGYNYLVPQA